MAGKKFAAEFALRRNVSAQDKILIQDSDDDVVKYAYPPQIASLSGYAYAQSVADLPLLPTNKSIGYIVGQMLYIYVGMGGDTKDGLYQSVGFFVGPQGVQGEKGEKGERGEQGVQGPKGDNGGLSLQEIDKYLATKQYVTGDTLADMLAGYVSNTSLMRDYVTIAKTQDVTGVKNFTAGVQFGGLSMYKSKGDTVYLDANLVVRGGITAFGTNKTITASIFEALPIDGATLKRTENGVLYVDTNVVGGGGSGGGSVDPSQLEAYLKPYAKTADVASTYATIASLSAVTSRLNDFLAASDTDAIINKWSELETFLAGLTETDNLATILSGKANKATTLAGYGITDAYTKSHIDSNFVTIGTKQEITGEKDFVGGFKVNGGLVEYNATLKAWVLNGDLLVTGGVSAFSNISGFKPSTITDAVLIDDRTIKRNADGLLYAVAQGAGGINEDQLEEYLRPYATQDWVTGRGYITSSALEPYALKTAIPTSLKNPNALSWSGYSSGSYDGSTAQSITIPNNTNQLTNGAGFITGITSSMVTNALGYTPLSTSGGTITGDFYIKKPSNATIIFQPSNASKSFWFGVNTSEEWFCTNGGYTKTYKLIHSGNYSDYALPKDGTAVAATTLKTSTGYVYARAFNVDKIVDIGADATFQGYSTYIDGMYIRFRYGSANVTAMQIGTDGNVGIGGTTASEKLHVHGNILATGGVTATNSSDERLKRNLRLFNASKVLMSLGGVWEYEYVDSEVQENHIYEGTHYGLIYQRVKGTTLDVMCHEREDGMGALNYIHPKFISLIAGATMENISEVEKLKRKIRHLENKVKQLEQRA